MKNYDDDNTLKTNVKILANEMAHINESIEKISKSFDDMREDLKKNYASMAHVESSVKIAIHEHLSEHHTGIQLRQVLRTLFLLVGAGGGGFGINELLQMVK